MSSLNQVRSITQLTLNDSCNANGNRATKTLGGDTIR